MSQDIGMTMQNPLYGVQSAHFKQAVQIARKERNRVLRRLVETMFGRFVDQTPAGDDQAEIDKADAIAADMLQYSRPF